MARSSPPISSTTASITTVKGEAHVTSKLYETRGATVVYTVDTKVRNIESRSEGLAAVTAPIGKRLRKDGLSRQGCVAVVPTAEDRSRQARRVQSLSFERTDHAA